MLLTFISLILAGVVLRYLIKRKDSDVKYYDGPTPSKEEQNKNQNFISDHLVNYPGSIKDLGSSFPQAANRATAVLRYEELHRLRALGLITESRYQSELEEIAELIDISEDIC
jgi:hypothetical protein